MDERPNRKHYVSLDWQRDDIEAEFMIFSSQLKIM